MPSLQKTFKWTFISLLLVAGIGLFIWFREPLMHFLQGKELQAFIEQFGIWSGFVYGLIYILVSLLGVSTIVMTILAGTIFGTTNGLLIVVLSATVSAIIAFYLSRRFADNLPKYISDNAIMKKIIEQIEKQADQNGLGLVLLMRLSFMPYIIFSYACGFVQSLKAKDFILGTLLANVFGSFVFIFLGNSIKDSWYVFLGAVILVVFFMQLPKIIKKFTKVKTINQD